MLEAVAPTTSGKMTIGTIDCTVEKSLCDKYKVRGYPTLKYAVDGEVMEYPGGRSESQIKGFATKMSGPPVEFVPSLAAAKQAEGTDGVVFVGYHPALVTVEGMEAKLESSRLTKVYGQVAKKLMAVGTFLLVDTSGTEDDEAAAAAVAEMGEGPFICRLEEGVDPRCYFRISDSMNESQLQEWITKENQPTVIPLGSENFHKSGRMGRPLVIAAVKIPDHVNQAKATLTKFAISGPESVRNKYYYGYMDSVRWGSFLKQFEVNSKALPHIFILDVPRKKYWTDPAYGMDIDKFMAAVEDGTIPKKTAGEGGLKGALEEALRVIIEYSPWSLIAIIVVVIGSIVLLVRCCMSATQGLRPPYPRNDEAQPAGEEKPEETESKKDK